MGITTDKFFENIYNVIFTPKTFFNSDQNVVSLRLAVGVVIFISAFTKITVSIFNADLHSNIWFYFSLVFDILSALFLWFITGLFFEYIAKIFNQSGKLREILFYTAYAFIPYLFFAPLNLVKNIGAFGYLLGSTFGFLLYLWIIFLYVLILSSVYKITLSRAFMLILIPIASLFFSVYWIICFLIKVCYIFSI